MRAKVEELLKNFRAYRYAKTQYEKHRLMPAAGTANYSGMPGGSGVPELFFAPIGKLADYGKLSHEDHEDYKQYKKAVDMIEGALDTLNDDERSIVKMKWMDNLTLQQIADIKKLSFTTVRRYHRNAMNHLQICFRFIDAPQIEEIPMRGSAHYHHAERNNSRVSQYMNDL